MQRLYCLMCGLCLVTIVQADDPQPLVLESLEARFNSDISKAKADVSRAEGELAKARKTAADARLKGYKEKVADVTKSGDLDKALALKARVTQLENEPESDSPKPAKRARPKDTIRFAGHSYSLIKDPATWHIAVRRCEEMGGHLVCIESPAEEAFVKQMAGKTTIWAGGSDEEVEGQWVWVHKNNPVKLTIAIDNAGDADHHLALYTGVWHDGHAGSRYAYICEWE